MARHGQAGPGGTWLGKVSSIARVIKFMGHDKSIPELSVDTRLLCDRLRELKPGETISYEDLSGCIGRSVVERARGLLTSARHIVLRDDRIVTEAVAKVGIKRLTDEEIVNSIGGQARRHIGRTARVAIRKTTAVKFDQLTSEQKVRQNTELSHLGALNAFSADKVSKRIEAKISTTDSGPSVVANTLKSFE